MKLPNVDQADVPQEKVTDYLLSATHRDGKHKAAFFLAFGFRLEAWHELAEALLSHARQHEVAAQQASPFGVRYMVEGTLPAPDGRAPNVRTVWFVDTGETAPRFVTAYPLKGEIHA
jgi:hypothetical protein